MMKLFLKKKHIEVVLPHRVYPSSIGLDISAFLLDENGRANSSILPPGNVKAIPTGLMFGGFTPPQYSHYEYGRPDPRSYPSVAMDPHHLPSFATVCSRSGLALDGVVVANSPGIIDPDYRGEILVLLLNAGNSVHYVRHGDRIAQLVIQAIVQCGIEETEVLSETARGDRGFGSSGQ